MKVRELIAILQTMPQEDEAVIYDADEACLLRLDQGNVWRDPADEFYKFDRTVIGGCYDERRIERDPVAVEKLHREWNERIRVESLKWFEEHQKVLSSAAQHIKSEKE